MKRFLFAAVAAASVASVALPAAAAPWQNINQRQAQLNAKINLGVQRGTLTRPEAVRLRSEFSSIARLETYYRRTQGRLVQWERNDLDRRFNVLQAKIRMEKRDYQRR